MFHCKRTNTPKENREKKSIQREREKGRKKRSNYYAVLKV
jgi:hypothetical protein